MKTTKKSLSIVLSILMLLSTLAPSFAFAADMVYSTSQAQFSYTYQVDGTVEITRANNCAGVVDVPSYIDGRPVTSIGAYAFTSAKTTVTINLPDTVITIKTGAFSGTAIQSFVVPSSVSTIQDTAFANCKSLTYIDFGFSVTSIGAGVCNGCSALTSVIIPAQIKEVPKKAFYNSGLKTVVLNQGLVKINDDAFYGTKLTTLTIPSTVTYVGKTALPVDSLKNLFVLSKKVEYFSFQSSSKNKFNVYAYTNSTTHKAVNKYNYSGKYYKFHSLDPKKPTISKPSAVKKGFKANWKPVAGADGYEIQYSTKASFKAVK